jgi:hypothetical protein
MVETPPEDILLGAKNTFTPIAMRNAPTIIYDDGKR